MTFTEDEIEAWLRAAQKSASENWMLPYRLGFGQGVIAVMIEFDNARRIRTAITAVRAQVEAGE